jgi:hypothetical protein
MNTIYKFIKSLKEISKYSQSAAVPGNKKAAKYLVYIGKLICINTENIINSDLIDFVFDKMNLALDSYQLDALKKITELIQFISGEIVKFNTQFCQYTAQLEMRLAEESSSQTSSQEEKNEHDKENDKEPDKENDKELEEEDNTPATQKYPLLTDNSSAKT